MPQISLVVCLHQERDLLQRLLEHAKGCYDDLVVVHDGKDETDVRSLVEQYGGRFFERPRVFHQEQHWPFAWEQARHDWILRWDADEFPSIELVQWIKAFRHQPELPETVSGYTCILPLWDGVRARTTKWPRRVVFINRQRVRYFGVAHQAPIADGRFEPLNFILHHQPKRKAYGIRYTVGRKKVRRWQEETAKALLGKVTDLPCWRWTSPAWPEKWERIRKHPILTGLYRLVFSPLGNARDMIRSGEWPRPSFLISFPLQHWLTCWSYYRARKKSLS